MFILVLNFSSVLLTCFLVKYVKNFSTTLTALCIFLEVLNGDVEEIRLIGDFENFNFIVACRYEHKYSCNVN